MNNNMNTLNSIFKDVALINHMISEWQEERDMFSDRSRYDQIRRIGILGTLEPEYRAQINACGRLAFAGLFSSTTLFPDDRDSIGEPDEDVAGFFQFALEHALAAYVVEGSETGDQPLIVPVLASLRPTGGLLRLSPQQQEVVARIDRATVLTQYRTAAHGGGPSLVPGDKVRLTSLMLAGAEVVLIRKGTALTLSWPDGQRGGDPRDYVLGFLSGLIWPHPGSDARLATFVLPADIEKVAGGDKSFVFFDKDEIENKLGLDAQG